jgi:hypothetical protein
MITKKAEENAAMIRPQIYPELGFRPLAFKIGRLPPLMLPLM